MGAFDSALGISPQVLALRARRMELLSANIANADTPGYKARDIDFARALERVRGDAPDGAFLRRTHEGHLGGAGDTDGPALYRVPSQPSLDGNTVESHREHAAMMDNAVRYQASLNLLDGRLRGLRTAIRGQL
jgi:flagellar basal-body rod protein FlgB